MAKLRWPAFLRRLRWLDGSPMSGRVEPYRSRIFSAFLDTFEKDGRPRYNLILSGRAKKNWKSADLALASLFCLVTEPPAGHDSECYLLANDKDQARNDLALAKKLIAASPALGGLAGDQARRHRAQGWPWRPGGAAGRRRCGHARRELSVRRLRRDPQLPELGCLRGDASPIRTGSPRSSGSRPTPRSSTDPDLEDATPEERANPSKDSGANPDYLARAATPPPRSQVPQAASEPAGATDGFGVPA